MSLKRILLDYLSVVAISLVYFLCLSPNNWNQFLIAIAIELPAVIVILFTKQLIKKRKGNSH
ncbi:hypothetical protein LPAF129_07950 [Ligilactobacillus pabuli]|uniref:Uncharacterized protein n=1 Tax=Ligilactobacillus pabuli TaxID=2886039 RepID=A0ABQ5JGG8_9LACO|nr:hypothetical protein LPAF129_07950 [Ligilactobacillus pabuli]